VGYKFRLQNDATVAIKKPTAISMGRRIAVPLRRHEANCPAYRAAFGFHSRANLCASAICSGVIRRSRRSRTSTAFSRFPPANRCALKVGIRHDLVARFPHVKAWRLNRWLNGWCGRRAYHKAVATGHVRFDLDGKPAGQISADIWDIAESSVGSKLTRLGRKKTSPSRVKTNNVPMPDRYTRRP